MVSVWIPLLIRQKEEQAADNLLKGEVGENKEYHKKSNISARKQNYFGCCKHIFKGEISFFF